MNQDNIRKILVRGSLLSNEPMSKHTTFRTGGPASLFAMPATQEEAAKLIRYLNINKIPYFVTGNGSNLLVSDKGFDGVIVNLGRVDDTDFVMLGYEEKDDGILFDAGCGCLLSVLASIAQKLGCTGFEPLSGIPGCIGGAVIMNAGAYGAEIKDFITEVTCIQSDGQVISLPKDRINFRYRGSSISDDGLVVSRVSYFLPYGKADDISNAMKDFANRRKEKQPIEFPSAGSTFKRPEGYYAGKLIEDSGLRGYTIGGACVSEKHCGFIINKGAATSDDIYRLICTVKQTVFEKFGVEMETEVKMLGDF